MERRAWLGIAHWRRGLGVGLVDISLIVAVIGLGLWRHGIVPWDHPRYTIVTVAPFLLSWIVVAPVVGAYSRAVLTRRWWAIGIVVVVWVVVVIIGSGIRAFIPATGGSPPVFVGVMVGSGLLILLPWRVVVPSLSTAVGTARL